MGKTTFKERESVEARLGKSGEHGKERRMGKSGVDGEEWR